MKEEIKQKPHIYVFLIILLGLLVYSNTLFTPFTFDDKPYIVDNPAIKDFSYFISPSKVLDLHSMGTGYRYAFITRIGSHFTFALNYYLHGLDVTGYHLFNIIVHVLNGLLVYALMRSVFQTPFFAGREDGPFSTNLFAFFSSLIFICHPVQTQAVTYISQRFASLATLFYLLALTAYIRSRISRVNQERYILYVLSFVSAVAAMLMKEISFTLPAIIALAEFMFFQERLANRMSRLVPFALTMFIIPSALLMATGASFSVGNFEESMKSLTSTTTDALTRWEYLFTQFRVIVTYIRLLFFPVDQNLVYDYPVYHSFFTPQVLFSFVFVALLFLYGVYLLFNSEKSKSADRYAFRLISFGILWFFITLSVESSIVVLRNVIFEHRLYLPMVGFAFSTMALFAMAVKRIKNRKAIIGCMVAVIFLLSGIAYARNGVWRNNIMLWEDVVSKSPNIAGPHHNLGVAYARHGRTEDAIKEYTIALEINPESAIAHNDLALAYSEIGLMEEAEREHRIAGSLEPGFFKAHNNLGFTYMKEGRTEDAIREYLLALRINPYNFDAHNNLGILFAQKGLLEEALKEFETARAIKPSDESVRKNIETIRHLVN